MGADPDSMFAEKPGGSTPMTQCMLRALSDHQLETSGRLGCAHVLGCWRGVGGGGQARAVAALLAAGRSRTLPVFTGC